MRKVHRNKINRSVNIIAEIVEIFSRLVNLLLNNEL